MNVFAIMVCRKKFETCGRLGENKPVAGYTGLIGIGYECLLDNGVKA
jgi:hypothetical protein